MGRIAKVKSFTRFTRNGAKISRIKADPGGGANVSADHFAPSGDDSSPLPDDYAVLVPIPGSGRFVAVGYLDPENEQKAAAGERRIYSRDPSGGAVAAEIWIKNDGTIIVDGSEVLLGKDAVNRVIDERLIDLYNSHTHSTTVIGSPTGPPIAGISAATVATTKTKAE